MSYTLGEAAKATGKSKPTIQRAIKKHIISAILNDNGSYSIDPAELHRVFPPVSCASNALQDMKQSEPPVDTPMLQQEIEFLKERLADKEGIITDLRQRLDQEGEDRRKAQTQLTALLTDQRKPTRRPWWVVWVLAVTAAAITVVWWWQTLRAIAA
jgi:hypothetical protein